MGIAIGTQGIGAIFIGAVAMAKVYIGSQLVWSGVPPVPPSPQIYSEFYVSGGVYKGLDNEYDEFNVLNDIIKKV